MATRKKSGESSEGQPQAPSAGSKGVAPKPAPKAAKPKPAATSEKLAAAPGGAARAKKPLISQATKDVAAKAVKKVAKKISDTVTELTKKSAGAKASKSAPPARATAAKTSATPTPKSTKSVTSADSSRKTAAPAATAAKASTGEREKSKSPTPRKTASVSTKTSRSRTAVGALSAGTTNEDVAADLLDHHSSDAFTSEDEITDRNPVDVKEHYFGEHRQGPPMPETRELPNEYGDTKIVLLIRDPEWVYAYWEINDASRAEFNLARNGHNRRLVVRLYKITGRNWPQDSAHYFLDLDVSPYASSWYIKLPEVNEKWCAELGIFDEENNYLPICRSNVIDTPRNTISEQTDSEWMIVEESFRKLYNMSGGIDVNGPGGVPMRGGSEAIIRQLQRTVTGLLSAEGSGLSSGSLYSGSILSGVVGNGAAKDFWLQVQTELILYGATEPNARVTVNGQHVRLNADGSFSLRFSLPDGEQTLTVHATNSDGDLSREIIPVVTKRTR